MRVSARTAALLLAAALVLGTTTGHAQSEPAAPAASSPAAQAEARQAMERGIAARDKGDHEAALVEYQKAIALVPEANVPHRFAAESLAALKRWEEAITSWETYLRIKPNVQDAAQVRARIDEIRAKHLEGIVDVECTPEGADVLLDPSDLLGESRVGVTPLHDLHVRAGAHTIVVQKAGYKEVRYQVPVTAGATRVVQCALEREGSATSMGPSSPQPESRDQKTEGGKFVGSAWFWAGLGALVVGGVVTAIVFGTQSSNDGPPATHGGTLRF